ncbi:hypothetical protein ABW19_dt0209509 [Dactylella cylindrospora]|nr:hypothetical protein ABW19_dt0209509 [Dactylella cylindrospora]
MAQNPGKSNPAISKIIGEMWKNASEETRKEWQNHADEEKRQHMARYPEYRYQPRRSSKKGSSSSATSPSDASEPSRCQRCGGRTGAYSLAESSTFPILPAPTPSAHAAPGYPRSSSLRSLLGPSTSPFSRHPSPGDHKRKRSDEADYHPGAEALLQLGSHERDYPSRSMAPTTSTTTTTMKPTTKKEEETNDSPPRPWKRRRARNTSEPVTTISTTATTSVCEPKVNTVASRTAASPAMSYQSATSDHHLERRVSDPASYRPMQQRHETFSPDYLEPNYGHTHHTHSPSRGKGRNLAERPTTAGAGASSTTPTTAAPADKIQQIQRITRPLSNRPISSAAASASGTGSSSSSIPPMSLSRTVLIAVEVSDPRLASTLSRGLHSELVEKFRSNVGVIQPMDVPEWRSFIQRSSGPEDSVSDYLLAVAAARRQIDSAIIGTAAAYDQSGSNSPWGHDPRNLPSQFRFPPPINVSILQQYIYTHAGAARRKLSPNGNVSPVYTWEWCIDVWRGSPRPDITIVVRNDDGSGGVNLESPELGLLSVPGPTAMGGKTWESSVMRRLAFEVQELIANR